MHLRAHRRTTSGYYTSTAQMAGICKQYLGTDFNLLSGTKLAGRVAPQRHRYASRTRTSNVMWWPGSVTGPR